MRIVRQIVAALIVIGAMGGPVAANAVTTVTTADGAGSPPPAMPLSAPLCKGASPVYADYFTLSTSSASAVGVTWISVTLPASAGNYVSQVDLTDGSGTLLASTTTVTSGATLQPDGAHPAGTTALQISSSSPANLRLRITPKATFPTTSSYPNNSQLTGPGVGGYVRQVYAGATYSGSSPTSATIYVQAKPSASSFTSGACTAPGQVALNWSFGDSAASVVILRKTSSISDYPAAGTTYTAGQTIGTSTVVYVGSATSFNDTSVVAGNSYYYKIFSRDLCGNYESTGTQSPAIVTDGTPAPLAWGVANPTSNQIGLSWTGLASSALLLRSTAPISDVPTDGQVYAAGAAIGQSTVLYAGAGQTFGDASAGSGPYYYRVFNRGICNGYSPGVDLGPLQEAPMTGLPASNGRIFVNSNNLVPTRTYSSATNTFGAAVEPSGSTTDGTGTLLLRAAPQTQQYLLTRENTYPGTAMYQGSGTTWPQVWLLGAATSLAPSRNYDIAYLSYGRAMLVQTFGVKTVSYNIWNPSTSSGSGNSYTSAVLTNTPVMMKLVPRPGTDELALVVADTDGKLVTRFWDGLRWSDESSAHTTQLYRGATVGDSDAFDGAWESGTGNFIVFFAEGSGNSSTHYSQRHVRSFPGCSPYACESAAWQARAQWGTGSMGNGPLQVVAAADPWSNKIVAATNAGQNGSIHAMVWDGSAFGANALVASSASAVGASTKPLAAGWVSSRASSAAVVMWNTSQTGGISYAYALGGSTFSAAQFASFGGAAPGAKAWMSVETDPLSPNAFMLTFSDAAKKVWAKRLAWQGGTSFTWSDADGGAALNASASTSILGFAFAYDRSLVQGWTTLIGDGTNPPGVYSSAPLCLASGAPVATPLDAFTVQSTMGDVLSSVTVSFLSGSAPYLGLVEVTSDDGNTQYGSVTNPASDVVTVPLSTPINATGLATQYRIRVTPKASSTLPTFTLSGTVTGVVELSPYSNVQDGTSATVYLQQSTPDASWGKVTPSSAQIALTWTEPSGIGSVLVLRNTIPITDAPVNSQTYAVNGKIGDSTVVYSGSETSFTDTSVASGATYYYKLFAWSACGGYSPGLQTGPWSPAQGAPASLVLSGGHLSYDIGGQAIQGKDFDGAKNAFSRTASADRSLGTGLTKYVDRAAPNRNEHLVGVTYGQSLYLQRWNGTSWIDDWSYLVPTTQQYTVTIAYDACNYPYVNLPLVTRRYDIAYMSSGDAMVVYAKGDGFGPQLGYRIWNGVSWSAEQILRPARLTKDVALVKLTPRPGTDELALTVSDTTVSGYSSFPTGNLTTLFWDGSGWGNEPAVAHTTTHYGTCQPGDTDDADGAYESLSGNFMLFWTEIDPGLTSISNKYRYYNRTSGWQAPVQPLGFGSHTVPGGSPGAHVVVAADPASNRIVAANDVYQSALRTGSQYNLLLWDGSSSSVVQTQGVSPEPWRDLTILPSQKVLAAGWVSRPGTSAAVVTWDAWDASGITYSYSIDGGAFSPPYYWHFGGTPPGAKSWIETAADPSSPDTLMVTFADAKMNVWAKRVTWGGGNTFTWSDADAGSPLNATPATDYRGFSFAYDRMPLTTVVADGTNPPSWPASSPLCPAPLGTPTPLDAFTLQNSAKADVVTAVTVSFAQWSSIYLAKVEVTDASGATIYGWVDYPQADVVTVPLATPITVSATATQYRIRVTPKPKSALPGAPGSTFTLTGVVTGVTGTYANQSVNDSASATIVIDNLAPGVSSWGTIVNGHRQGEVVRQSGQLTLNWTPAADASSVVILRSTAPITDAPLGGQAYLAPGSLGASTIAYAGSATSFTDPGLVDGTSYYYKLFSADPCLNYSAGVALGPVTPQPVLAGVSSGTLTASPTSCNQATLTASFAGDTNDNSFTTFQRSSAQGGPFSAVPGCEAVTGLSPRTCVDGTVTANSTTWYLATFTDPDALSAPLASSASLAPACSLLTLAPANPEPPAASVVAGTSGVTVGRFTLTASGTITLQSLSIQNAGSALGDRDLLPLLLFDEGSNKLLGSSTFDGTRYLFQGLGFPVAGSATLKLVMAVDSGAIPGSTFQMTLAPAGVGPMPPSTGDGVTVTGNVFTIVPGPPTGSKSLAAPTVQIVNPARGKITGPSFRVQVRVYNPGGLAALTGVTLTSDGWVSSIALSPNGNYPMPVSGRIYEATLNLDPGSYTLSAKASNAAGQSAISSGVPITVNQGGGDGNLLVRDNASQVCADCHTQQSHSSETTQSQYGSWSTACRDCHTPHATTNLYLLNTKITPPSVNGYQTQKSVAFWATTGDSAGGAPSYVNPDGSGPCQVCHTRTQDPATGLPRFRGAVNLDSHYTASPGPTERCTDCHLHSAGFAADPGGHRDCLNCHNALLTAMQASGTHHHYMASTWSGTAAASGLTVYPVSVPSSSQTDVNRRCLMCHVDHDLFLPAGRGMNLRTDIAATPAAPNLNFTNSDFVAATGGICLSCHQSPRTKAYVDPSGTAQTLAIDTGAFTASAHNYGATATFKGAGTAQFLANCSKCHDDRLAKRYQLDSVNRFGLHGADWMDSSTLCESCHRTTSDALVGWSNKPVAGMDLFNAQPMTPESSGIYRSQSALYWPDDFPPGSVYSRSSTLYSYYTPPTSYRTKHEMGVASAAHKPGAEGNAAADGTLSGANRHVECADCHDPHRATPAGGGASTVTGFVAGTSQAAGNPEVWALDVLTDNKASWPVNGRAGWTVKILSGTGAGSTSTIFASTATTLTVKFGGSDPAPAVGSTYVVIANGAYGAVDSGGPLQGVWGVEPSFPAQPSPPDFWDGWGTDGQPFTNGDSTFRGVDGLQSPATQPVYSQVAFTRTTTPSRSSGVCLKCHSSYAYGSDPANAPWSNNGRTSMTVGVNHTVTGFSSIAFNDFTIAGGAGCSSQLGSGSSGSAIAAKIQASPMGCVRESDVANEFNPNNLSHHAVFAPGKNQPIVSSPSQPSYYNTAWPKFISSASVTVSVQDNASGKGVVTLAGTAGTAWPLTTLPGWFLYLGSNAPAQGATGWYQVAAVTDSAHLTLDRSAAANAGASQGFMLTPGLGATFVPPWGPWSTLKCTDCHASDDVGAPAGAADPFGPHGSGQKWLLRNYKGKTYPAYSPGASTSSALAGQFTTVSNTAVEPGGIGNVPYRTNFCLNCHRFEVYGDTAQAFANVNPTDQAYSRQWHPPHTGQHYTDAWSVRGIPCTICHGGARVGSIHGSNLGHGHTTDFAGGSQRAASYSGKRLMNGEALSGVRRGSKSSAVTCYTKPTWDSVSICGYDHQQYNSATQATYDYEGGADP